MGLLRIGHECAAVYVYFVYISILLHWVFIPQSTYTIHVHDLWRRGKAITRNLRYDKWFLDFKHASIHACGHAQYHTFELSHDALCSLIEMIFLSFYLLLTKECVINVFKWSLSIFCFSHFIFFFLFVWRQFAFLPWRTHRIACYPKQKIMSFIFVSLRKLCMPRWSVDAMKGCQQHFYFVVVRACCWLIRVYWKYRGICALLPVHSNSTRRCMLIHFIRFKFGVGDREDYERLECSIDRFYSGSSSSALLSNIFLFLRIVSIRRRRRRRYYHPASSDVSISNKWN